MRLTHLIGQRFKQRPAEARWDSHALLLRGGYLRPMPKGGFGCLTPATRVLQNIERCFSTLLKERGAQPLCLNAEDAALDLLQNEVQSYAQLPCCFYHRQAVHHTEERCYGGLIQTRNYTRLEALFFHQVESLCKADYEAMLAEYQQNFSRLGLGETLLAKAFDGHAFFLPLESGEDLLVTTSETYSTVMANAAQGYVKPYPASPAPVEKLHTPGCKSIEDVAAFLELPEHQCAKVVFFASDDAGKVVMALIRGDREVNEGKLARIIGVQPVPAEDAAILAVGATPGYASPMGLDSDKLRIVVDHSIAGTNNLVAGANETDYHYINFNLERDLPGMNTVDIDLIKEGDPVSEVGGTWTFLPGIVLGTARKVDAPPEMTYTDEAGKEQTPLLHRCSIGLERLMAAVAEKHHDKFGPKWPAAIAPWQVHLCVIDYSEPTVKQAAESLYEEFQSAGYAVLFDDRGARPGVQFADADLLGAPLRFILSARNLENQEVEWKRRDTGEAGRLPMDEILVDSRLNEALGELS